MAERPIALVLKTRVGDEPTVGSNPTLSATIRERASSDDDAAHHELVRRSFVQARANDRA